MSNTPWSRAAAGSADAPQTGAPSAPAASDLSVRAAFGGFLAVGYVLGILLRNDVSVYVTKWAVEKDGQCGDPSCIRDQGAYRISFALFVFFGLHYLASHRFNLCCSAGQRVAFNRPHAIIRGIILIALLLIAFAMPNSFFTGYAWLCLVVSVFYLIAQLIVLIDASYKWNDSWGEKGQEQKSFFYGLLVVTGACYIAALVILGYEFKWYGNDSSCSTGQGMLSVTIISAALYTVLSIAVEHGSLLPSSIVFLYTVWTCYSALSSGIPAGRCNGVETSSTTQLIIGTIVSCGSLVYAATNAGASRDAFTLSNDQGDDAEQEAADNFSFFHLMMTLGSGYLAMLLTSWRITDAQGSNTQGTDSGEAAMWAKFGSELLCILLYTWTLIAPTVCKSRFD